MFEISSAAAKEIADQIKSQFDQLNKATQENFLAAAKNSPFGSDMTLVAVRAAKAK